MKCSTIFWFYQPLFLFTVLEQVVDLDPQNLETEEDQEVVGEGEGEEGLEWIEVVCGEVKWGKDTNLEKICANLDGTCHDCRSLKKISMLNIQVFPADHRFVNLVLQYLYLNVCFSKMSQYDINRLKSYQKNIK